MAETYHILDYKSVPIQLLATLASGLRENSRIRCKMFNVSISLDTFFIAGIYDKVNWLAWSRLEAAQSGKQKAPEAILPLLLDTETENDNKVVGFESPDDFEAERQRILGGKNGNGTR